MSTNYAELNNQRADYDDLERPRRKPMPATNHYWIVTWIYTVYGALFLVPSFPIFVFFIAYLEFGASSYEAENGAILTLVFSIVGAFFAICSIFTHRQKSLRAFKILSVFCCFLGIFPLLGLIFFGWVGIYGLIISSQLPIRRQLGYPIPEYLNRISQETTEEAIFRDPVAHAELMTLRQQMIEKSNRRLIPLRAMKILGYILLAAVCLTLLVVVIDVDDFEEMIGISIGVLYVALVYWATFFAFRWIAKRQNSSVVYTIMVFQLVFGLVPYFGVVNYALGIWMLTVLTTPEVERTYGKNTAIRTEREE